MIKSNKRCSETIFLDKIVAGEFDGKIFSGAGVLEIIFFPTNL